MRLWIMRRESLRLTIDNYGGRSENISWKQRGCAEPEGNDKWVLQRFRLWLLFTNMEKQAWLEFVVNCRKGIEHHYDIVEGPMADDTIWDYIKDYTAGAISKSAFWELVKFKYPTYQIVFCTDKALSTLNFVRSYEI